MKIVKWGNSLAVRLPASVVDALDLKNGDHVDIRAAAGAFLMLPASPHRKIFFCAYEPSGSAAPPTSSFTETRELVDRFVDINSTAF